MMNRYTQRRSDEATSRPRSFLRSRSAVPAFRSPLSAFTLIEILVTIGIIGVLAGMIIYGIHAVMANTNRNSTRVTLQNSAAMLDEWSKFNNGMVNLPSAPLYATGPNLAFNRPTKTDVLDTRILLTRAVYKRLMRAPAIAKMQQNMPQQMLLTWPVPAPTKGLWALGTTYQLGDTVSYPALNPTLYICGNNNEINHQPNVELGVPFWFAYDNNNPSFLDAWYNPILFVPATGLVNVTINGQPCAVTSFGVINQLILDWSNVATYNPGAYVYYSAGGVMGIYRCVSAPAVGVAPNTTSAWVLQPAKPFFASAGPDGDFSTGDDNIYSFEN